MARYKKKNLLSQYSPENLENAVGAVKADKLSIRKAAAYYHVPRSTVHDRVHGRGTDRPIGRPPALPQDIEDQIIAQAQQAAEEGFGIGVRQLQVKTARVAHRLSIETPFKEGIPGREWFAGVKKRHPDMSLRKPEATSSARLRTMKRSVVDDYFQALSNIIIENRLGRDQIWNMDESGFMLTHKPTNVIARKGTKNIVGRTANSRESLSVLACVCANGTHLPPMIIVRGKTIRSLHRWNVEDAPKDTLWTHQSKAFMEAGLAEEWMTRLFIPAIKTDRPNLLILDGHSTHETLDLLTLASDNNIIMLALPPHSTNHLQPLDKTIFGPMKNKYDKLCSEHMSASPFNTINKQSWPALFASSFQAAMTCSNIQSGFRATGIWPTDQSVIPESAYSSADHF